MAILVMTLNAHLATAQAFISEGDRKSFEIVLRRVNAAFETRIECRNLFGKYHTDGEGALKHATFVYVGTELKQLGAAAVTVIGTHVTLVGSEFYKHLSDIDGLATLLIHELLHQQGAGTEIDDYFENYEYISKACGTRNSAK